MNIENEHKEKIIVVPRFNEANGFYTTKQRSIMMSKIRGKNTKPEIILRKALWALNIRYRTAVKDLPGRPDILIRKYNLAIFVDGEFWHGYNWEDKKLKLKTNTSFWVPKIERNIQRDRQNDHKLAACGFHVLRFWENDIKKDITSCLKQILDRISTCESRGM